jgi:glycerol uptake facilitator-like aquaporin
VGTYLLVFLGPASVVVAPFVGFQLPFEALTLVATVFGCTVASLILLLGRFSGAHINPAITVASGLAGGLKRQLIVPYLVFQIIGGLLAGLSLKVVFGSFSSFADLGSTKLAPGMTPVEGVALKMAGTIVLAFSVLYASTKVRGRRWQATLVGATLLALIMLIGPLTGASFNPARSLGPSLFSGYFANQYVYWVGPFVCPILT